jgi:hypothetical protein
MPDIDPYEGVVSIDAAPIIREFIKHWSIPRDHPNPAAFVMEYYMVNPIHFRG